MQSEIEESSSCSSNCSFSSQEEKLSKLLDEWNFGHMLVKLQSEAITIKRLKYLTESDLDKLFRNKKIGEKAEFRFHLLEWKKQKGYSNIASSSASLSNLSTNLCINNSKSTTSSDILDLRSILRDHPTGDYVFKTFAGNKKLDDVARKILVEAIVTWSIKTKNKFTKNTFEKISTQIESDFSEDKEVYYRKVGSRSSGRLFDKYYNTIKRMKKTGEWDTSNINISADILTNENFLNDNKDEADVRKAHEWVKVFTEPWSEVTKNWRTCYCKRRDDIHTANEDNIVKVLNKWKLFSHSLGYILVDIDFSILHPSSPCISDNWESFKHNLIPILNQKIKDTGSLQYLKKIKANDTGSEQLIFLLLHVILRPSIKRKSSDVIYRSTIKDSQRSFLLHSVTTNDVQNQLEQLKSSLYKRGETLQPLIVAVGLDISDATFYVYYDEIKYKLPSFLTSLDTCFKIFQVLNLKYPRDCSEVWTFIQRYFYGIKLKEDQISPNILCLINNLT